MLFIYPPISKPCEPPAGIARLAGAMRHHQLSCRLIDANIEAIRYLLSITHAEKSKHIIRDLKEPLLYQQFPHQYKNAVRSANELLKEHGRTYDATLTLKNVRLKNQSPVRKQDLIRAYNEPQRNPFYPYFKAILLPRIEPHAHGVIAISIIYLSQALTAFSLIGLIKKHMPQCRVVIGGGLVSTWMSHPNWNDPFDHIVDVTVAGNGEAPLLKMMGIPASPKISYVPDYSQLPWDDYLSPKRILPYAASAGCYWRKCTFCPEKTEQNRFLPIPHHHVLKTLGSHKSPGLIHFLDNAASPALMRRISQKPLRTPWYGYARFERALLDIDFCHALKKSGCVMLQLGLESGDQRVLDKMQKGIVLKNASQILRNLRRAGIAVYLYLLFGTPYESYESAVKTMTFVAKHADSIDFINTAIFNLPIFSRLAQELPLKPFYAGDLSLYSNFENPYGWHRGKIRQFLSKAFRKHPKIAPIIRQVPLVFTSGHAPFFVMKP